MRSRNPKLKDVIFPYMIGRDLLEAYGPNRWIIDFGQVDLFQAMQYKEAFERAKKLVMPSVLEKAERRRRRPVRRIPGGHAWRIAGGSSEIISQARWPRLQRFHAIPLVRGLQSGRFLNSSAEISIPIRL